MAAPFGESAVEAMDAIARVTGTADRFGNRPAGTRAIQLRDSHQGAYFLEVFGRPKRNLLYITATNSLYGVMLHVNGHKTF